jgi:hypothetical protein
VFYFSFNMSCHPAVLLLEKGQVLSSPPGAHTNVMYIYLNDIPNGS